MLGVALRRDLAGMSDQRLLDHMIQMESLWISWGRPAGNHLPKNFREEVERVRAELVRRGHQLTLF